MESCKLLDFEKHLARRTTLVRKTTGPNEVSAAAGGTGREFINVDELIQAQISEGCHGVDAFAAPSGIVEQSWGGSPTKLNSRMFPSQRTLFENIQHEPDHARMRGSTNSGMWRAAGVQEFGKPRLKSAVIVRANKFRASHTTKQLHGETTIAGTSNIPSHLASPQRSGPRTLNNKGSRATITQTQTHGYVEVAIDASTQRDSDGMGINHQQKKKSMMFIDDRNPP